MEVNLTNKIIQNQIEFFWYGGKFCCIYKGELHQLNYWKSQNSSAVCIEGRSAFPVSFLTVEKVRSREKVVLYSNVTISALEFYRKKIIRHNLDFLLKLPSSKRYGEL